MTHDWPGRAAIAQQARRSQRWRLPLGLALAILLLPVVHFAFTDGQLNWRAEFEHSALVVAVPFGLAWVVSLLMSQSQGWFTSPITLGLSRAQRRSVRCAIKTGEPSDDADLAAVELETADRRIRNAPMAYFMLGILTLGSAFMAFTLPNLVAQLSFGVLAVGCASYFRAEIKAQNQARHYLSTVWLRTHP